MKACIIWSIVLLAATFGFAAPGDLDPTFGIGGKLIDNITDWDTARAVAIQPDGKILVAGGGLPYPGGYLVLARYDSNGSPDLTFGYQGKVLTSIDDFFEITSITLEPDGKIIAVGCGCDYGSNYFVVARYFPNGTPDTSFCTPGYGLVIDSMGEEGNNAVSVIVQPDEKVVVAGSAQSHHGSPRFLFLVRYESNGSHDVSFGVGGKVTTTITGNDGASSVAIQPDGKIIAAGWSLNRFALVRYMPNGSLDPGFGLNGKVITKFESSASANSVVLQPDGKIVAAGGNNDGSVFAFALARYQANGSLDPSFGSNGKVTTPILGGGRANSIALQPDGKLLVAGSYPTNGDFVQVRYDRKGLLDRSFGGGDGIATADFDHSIDEAYGLALDSGGRAVVAGATFAIYPNYPSFAIARFLLSSDSAFPFSSP
jgi:uncharacterized delta-60 repeat protein